MILSLFKTRQPGFYALTVLAASLLYLLGFRNAELLTAGTSMPLFNLILSLPLSTTGFYLIGWVVFVLQVVHVNMLVGRYEVLYKASFLPGLFYMLLCSLIPEFLIFSPALLVNSFLLLMLDRLFFTYKKEEAARFIFESAALLSVAVLIYFPAAGFILAFFAALLLLRPFELREWMAALMGLSAPLYVLAALFFLINRTDLLIPDWSQSGLSSTVNWKNVIPVSYRFSAAFVFVLLVVSLFKLRENFYKNSARTRAFQQVLMVTGLAGLIILLFTYRGQFSRYLLLVIPCSVIISYYFQTFRKKWIAELLFWMIIAILLVNHFSTTFRL